MSALPTPSSLAETTVRVLCCLGELLHLTSGASAVALLPLTATGLRSLELRAGLGVDLAATLSGQSALLRLTAILNAAILHCAFLLCCHL